MKDKAQLMADISSTVHEAMIQEEIEFVLEPEDLAASVLIPVKEMMDYVFEDKANEVLVLILKKIDQLGSDKPTIH